MDKVKEIADDIISLYKTQKYTQEDIAIKFGVSIGFVSEVTKGYNYNHRIKKELDNLKDNETIRPVIDYRNLTEYYNKHEKHC